MNEVLNEMQYYNSFTVHTTVGTAITLLLIKLLNES